MKTTGMTRPVCAEIVKWLGKAEECGLIGTGEVGIIRASQLPQQGEMQTGGTGDNIEGDRLE